MTNTRSDNFGREPSSREGLPFGSTVLPIIGYQVFSGLLLLFFLTTAFYVASDSWQQPVLLATVFSPNQRLAGIILVGFGLLFWLMLTALLAYRLWDNLDWFIWRLQTQGPESRPPSLTVPAGFEHQMNLLDRDLEAGALAVFRTTARILLHEIGDHVAQLGMAYDDMMAQSPRGISSEPSTPLGCNFALAVARLRGHFEALRDWLTDGINETNQSLTVDVLLVVTGILKNLPADQRARVVFKTPAEITTSLVSGIPDLIRSAVNNLVRNALVHNPEQTRVGITLVPSREISNTSRVTLQIADTGPRLDNDQQARVFQLASTDPLHGIGLPLSRAVITSFGGDLYYSEILAEIEPDSKDEWTKAFCIELPHVRRPSTGADNLETRK